MSRLRWWRRPVDEVLPAARGTHQGLSYALFEPDAEPEGAVVVLHGAGSRKESHFDTARVLRAARFAVLLADARGHGESPGAMDGRAIEDVAVLAELARERTGGVPVALRGSSMGGYLALVAAQAAGAAAVVAICPAPAAGLRRGLAAGRFEFTADHPSLDALLEAHDEVEAARTLQGPLLLLHAEGDEQVPVEHSRAIHAAAQEAGVQTRLVVVPGGHHRTAQHDPELQALTVRWLRRVVRER